MAPPFVPAVNYTLQPSMKLCNNVMDQAIANCSCSANNATATMLSDNGVGVSAFMYIVVVLSFYAVSMVLLMIKYIKREREEALFDYYYLEFVKRESFNAKAKLLDRRTAKRNILLKYLMPEEAKSDIGEDTGEPCASEDTDNKDAHCTRVKTEIPPTPRLLHETAV